MRLVTIDVAWSLCVCLLDTTMSHAKTDEPSTCYLGCGIGLAQETMPCSSHPVQRGLCVCCVYTTVSYAKTLGIHVPFYCALDGEHMLSCIKRNGWPDRDTGWSVELDASIEWRLVGGTAMWPLVKNLTVLSRFEPCSYYIFKLICFIVIFYTLFFVGCFLLFVWMSFVIYYGKLMWTDWNTEFSNLT